MANQEYRFETKQVHVGQEQPDPTTDAIPRQCMWNLWATRILTW